MGALSRVLNDEHRKSMELTYNIMRIFLAFSNFIEVGMRTPAPPLTSLSVSQPASQ